MDGFSINADQLSSMNAGQLSGALDLIAAEVRNIHQNPDGTLRSLTDDDKSRMEFLLGLHTSAQAHQKIRGIVDHHPDAIRPGAFNFVPSHDSPAPDDVVSMKGDQLRSAAMRMLDARSRALPADAVDHVDDLLRSTISADQPNVDGSYIAQRILITESPAYRSAFQQVISEPMPLLNAEETAALRSLRKLDSYRSMGEVTPSAGGYGVPVFIDSTIMITAQGSVSPMREIAKNVTITTNQWKGVSSAGVSWSWYTEGGTTSDNSPTLAQPAVPVHMARGWVEYSIEVGMDYPSFAQEMSGLLNEGYDDLSAQAFITGTGSSQPTGILTALDADANVEILLATAGSIGAVDINKAWEALPDRWKSRSNWLMSYNVSDTVAGLGNGNNLAWSTVDFTGVVQTLRTRPVRYASYMPALNTTGHTNAAVVGDFQNYLIANRAGMSVELVPHLFDVTNNRPVGKRGFFAWARVGGACTNTLGFRLINQT